MYTFFILFLQIVSYVQIQPHWTPNFLKLNNRTKITSKVPGSHASRTFQQNYCKKSLGGFPGGAVVGNLPANAGDMGSSPGLGRSHMPQSN